MRKSSTIAPASVGVLAVSPAEGSHIAGIGRTMIYHAISAGDLKSLKIGARRLGRIESNEYVALNLRRSDRQFGSFSINLRTGRWADFAIDGARGGNPISLAAYLCGIGQAEAAVRLAATLGIKANDAR